jgi:hypothetical protein
MKNASKSVCKSATLVYHHPFSYSINFFSYEAPENTEEDPDDPESADERNIQMEYSFTCFYSPSIGAVTKNYL